MSSDIVDIVEKSYAPCAWWPDMQRLRDLAVTLRDHFGIERTPRSLQNVLLDLGITASHIHIDPGGYGRVGYYDPIVCWAVLTAVRSDESRAILGERFRNALVRASDAVWQDLDARPDSDSDPVFLEWQWRCQSTAVHLFISDPRHGLRPYEVVRHRLAGLTKFTLDSPHCLAATLSIYMDDLAELLAVRDADAARALLSEERSRDREDRVIAALDAAGVLRASVRRLGPAPCAVRS